MLSALVEGASMASSVGSADRSMVLRLIKHSSSTAREQNAAARGLVQALGQTLGSALDRAASARGKVIAGDAQDLGQDPVAVPARRSDAA